MVKAVTPSLSKPARAADSDARLVTLALLARRRPDATVCPSEVARALVAASGSEVSPQDWRTQMPGVHAAIDTLLAEGLVRLSWKGEALARRSGPYRITAIPLEET